MRIFGGLVVTPAGEERADVVVEDGRIAAIEPATADGDVDARGCVVLPAGVDPHTHPLHDLRAATVSARAGGTTTVLSFTLPHAGETPAQAWRRARDELLPLAVTDVRLHPSIWQPDRLFRPDLEELRALGATSVKLFLAYPELGMMASDRTLYETLRDATALGMTVMVHCENGGLIEALVEERLAAGDTGVSGFVSSRPPEAEEEAVTRVLALARRAGAAPYLVHLSSGGSLDAVREARRRGQRVWAEVCTHHLLLDESRHALEDGQRWLTAPPLRAREHVEALWRGIEDGTVDAIGSDHEQARYFPEIDADDFRALPYGFSGVGARLPLALSEGRRRGVPYARLAALLATTPARVFGIDGVGAIEPGGAAELVVWDPEVRWTFRPEAVEDVTGPSVFEGLEVEGGIRKLVTRRPVE